MSAIVKINDKNEPLDQATLESLILRGDTSKLTPNQKMAYAIYRCNELGIDPAIKPFEYMLLNGKEILYLNKGGADALCQARGTTRDIVSKEMIGDILVMTVKATDKNGRYDVSTGAICLKGLSGQNLANAMMKCETKAKRRSVVSLYGLGVMDESEVDDISGAKKVHNEVTVVSTKDTEKRIQLHELAQATTQVYLEEANKQKMLEAFGDDDIPEPPRPKTPIKLPETLPEGSYEDFIFSVELCNILKAPGLENKKLRDLSMEQLTDWANYFNDLEVKSKDLHNRRWFKYLSAILTDELSDRHLTPSA